jgi:antitoxin HigA-1
MEDINMDRIPNVTPGEILKEEFLIPMSISAYKLAKDTHMPATRISEILKGRRKITADTALRLSAYFGNSPDFWLGIQDEYDLRKERVKIEKELLQISRSIASYDRVY